MQVVVGTATAPSRTPRPGRTAVQLEVNVDDVTGEVLAHTIAALVAAGAHDAWATPIVMKKGRPAHTVAALVDPADVERLAAVLLAETGSLGVRAATVERWPQRREEVVVDVDGHPVRVKLGGGRAKPEHDDAAARPRRSASRCATCCGTRKRWPPAPTGVVASSFGIGRIAPIPKDRTRAARWVRSRSVISGGGSRAASSCCATSASPSATAIGPRSSAPTASASRR